MGQGWKTKKGYPGTAPGGGGECSFRTRERSRHRLGLQALMLPPVVSDISKPGVTRPLVELYDVGSFTIVSCTSQRFASWELDLASFMSRHIAPGFWRSLLLRE